MCCPHGNPSPGDGTSTGASAGVGSNALEVYIHRLRRKLADSGLNIRNVRGLGHAWSPVRREPGRHAGGGRVQDATYLVLDNKWTAMTGAHENPNSGPQLTGQASGGVFNIERTFKGLGVKHVEKANPYNFRDFQKKLKKIQADPDPQLRVLISEAECQLQRQRTVKPMRAKAIAEGKRTEVERLGVDEEVCVGDHSCMRVNGCPSLDAERPASGKSSSTSPATWRAICGRWMASGSPMPNRCCCAWASGCASPS